MGYLAYSLYTHIRFHHAPTGDAALLVVFGTQFPDLIDKPLAWMFAVLPSGRSLAHSLLTMTVIIVVVVVLARRIGRPLLGRAFAIGYFTHLLTDGLQPLLAGDFEKLTYLFWPLIPSPEYELEQGHGILAHLKNFELTSVAMAELLIVGLVFLLWMYDDAPGTKILWTMWFHISR